MNHNNTDYYSDKPQPPHKQKKNKGRSNDIARLGLTAYPSESTKHYTEY